MRLRIRDLEQRSGLPRRTIHYYAHQGLLPAPHGAGPGASYDEEHLLRLRLIPVLQKAGLRLERIGCALASMTLSQMRRLIDLARDSEIADPHQLASWLSTGCGQRPAPAPVQVRQAHRPEAENCAGPSQWVRYQVTPRLEIHYCAEGQRDAQVEAVVRRLGELAGKLIDEQENVK